MRSYNVIPRTIAGVVLFAIFIGVGVGIGTDWNWTAEPPTGTTVAPSPPPRHIEWDYRQVGGYILLNPAITDSLGRHPGLTIPEGAILGVPHLVAGEEATTT